MKASPKPNRPKPLEVFLFRAVSIAEAYCAVAYPAESDAPAGLRPRRLAFAPRDRPINVLKRDIYQLACDIDARKLRPKLEAHTRALALQQRISYRPRHWTVIDWTVRFVLRCDMASKLRRIANSNKPTRKAKVLLEDAQVARISAELNFAFRHGIAPSLTTTFIDELGGYPHIFARLNRAELDLTKDDWWHQLRWEQADGEEAEYLEKVMFPESVKLSLLDGWE